VDVLPTRELSSNASEVIERTLHSDSNMSEEAVISSPSRPTATSQPSPAKPSEDVLSMVASVDKPTGDDGVCLVPSNTVHTVATRNADSSTKDDVALPIRSRLVPEGILIESDDVEADDAVKMLADLLDGGQSLADVPGESLVNGGRTSALGDSFAGSFLLKREGMMTVTAGTATVVSDARLNRLIVQGTAQDVSTIEGYLKIIDKGTSLTSIETAGKAHVIELVHTKASDVAEAIKQAYATRIANNDNNRQANQRGNDREERDPRQANNNSDTDRGRGNQDGQREVDEKPTRGRQAEMTVAVHEPSNSLIITAPDALFAEVENLVKMVDTRSEQDVQVIPVMVGVDPELMLKTLGVDIGTSTSDRPSPSNDPSAGSRSSRPTGSR
jgi:type II secretory pathway component GspD/PulD (secretin)